MNPAGLRRPNFRLGVSKAFDYGSRPIVGLPRMRLCLSALKPLVSAAGLLLASACGIELYLRIAQPAGRGDFASSAGGLTEPSATVHHRLRPLSSFVSRDPDTGEAVEVLVNSHGLRGTESSVPKTAGVFRVLCFGGETVLGAELSEPHTLPARLQALLQAETRLRIEVLNAGVPGDCPLLSWLRLRESLLGLQPDLVLVHFDMADVAEDQRFRRRTRVGPSGAPIACRHPAVDLAPTDRAWWRDLRLIDAATEILQGLPARRTGDPGTEVQDPRAATAWLRDNPPDWDLYIEQALAPIEDVGRAANGTGATLVLTTCPQPWQVSEEASNGPGVRESAGIAEGALLTNRTPFDAVAAFARGRGILCCDASAAFRDFPEPTRLYFRNSPNLSRYGQELYARELCDFIKAEVPQLRPTERGSRFSDEAAPVTIGIPESGVARPFDVALPPWQPAERR